MKMKKILLLAVPLLLMAANCFARYGLSEKPNIVFLMVDDQRWDDVGCYVGAMNVMPPHIDKMAEQGVAVSGSRFVLRLT